MSTWITTELELQSHRTGFIVSYKLFGILELLGSTTRRIQGPSPSIEVGILLSLLVSHAYQ